MTARMPFGRHRGKLLSELPDGYLEWLLSRDNLREPLRGRLDAEQERRRMEHEATLPRMGIELSLAEHRCAERIIVHGFRALATRAHPDAGGDHETMIALNAAREKLSALLREAAA